MSSWLFVFILQLNLLFFAAQELNYTDSEECGPNEILVNSTVLYDLCAEDEFQNESCSSQLEVPLCQCISNYSRDDNGTCVSTTNFTQELNITESEECGPNEILVNSTVLYDLCAEDEFQNESCTSQLEVPLCQCISNYSRDDNGTCIPTTSFPQEMNITESEECGPNEILVNSTAEYDLCSLSEFQNEPCSSQIEVPICQCISNYSRDDNGTCILTSSTQELNITEIEECGPNEILVNSTVAYDLCSESEFQNESCTSQLEVPLCQCISNYSRDDNGTCVLTSSTQELNITEIEECGPNEILVNSTVAYDLCSESEFQNESCTSLLEVPLCQCISNYSRDDNGTCVLTSSTQELNITEIEECGPNEILVNSTVAYDLCSESEFQNESCSSQLEVPLCECISNYSRDNNGTCILTSSMQELNITESEDCGPNEVLANSTVAYDLCSESESQNESCTSQLEVPLCQCISNYSRDDNGTCILTTSSTQELNITDSEECGPNEILVNSTVEYDICPESEFQNESCTSQLEVPLCQCISNYSRNDNGTCILTTNSTQVLNVTDSEDCGPNEILVNDTVVYDFCPENESRNEACAAVEEVQYCQCVSDYSRNDNGTCIPTNGLPQGSNDSEECGLNEILVNSTITLELCTESLFDKIEDEPCVFQESRVQCECISDHIRNDNGTCIPSAGSQQESNIKRNSQACGPNEMRVNNTIKYNSCQESEFQDESCKSQNEIVDCECISNYSRFFNGTCIPTASFFPNEGNNETAEIPTCESNEILIDETRTCGSDFCPSTEFEDQCCDKEEPLGPQCKCRFNYRRDQTGKCIPTTSCPPFNCSGVNEEFVACPPLCPTDDCSQATLNGMCPLFGRIGIVLICTPRCRCKQNYWRKNGVCVPFEQCPPKQEINYDDIEFFPKLETVAKNDSTITVKINYTN